MDDGQKHCTLASVVAAGVGAHGKRQLTDAISAADHSALAVGLIDLTECVLERKPRTLAVFRAALGDPGTCPANCSTQALPTGRKPTVQGQIDRKSHKEAILIHLPPTLGSAKSPHGEANIDSCNGG